MKRGIVCLTAILLATALSAVAADKESRKGERRENGAETKRDIDQHIAAVNRLDNDKSAKMAGLAMISKETAVPVNKIEAEHKDHPNVGLAGLFMAHELAVKSSKPVEHFLKERKEGRTWTELARANNVSLGEVEAKLNRIEDAMRNAR